MNNKQFSVFNMIKISNLKNVIAIRIFNFRYAVLCACLTLFISCEEHTDQVKEDVKTTKNAAENIEIRNKTNKKYDLSYFSGEAEVSTYTLEKARYNNIHPGESVLIFVTEPFLKEKQVKADNPSENNSASVLKMNKVERFSTGIYDYSIFTSVFTPISDFDPRYPLKITMSSQDWCGQSFMQVNNNDGFDYLLRSYFESEGDTTAHLDYCYTEDNLFNLARIDTALLPLGEFDIIPSMQHLRLAHAELKSYTATASLANLEDQVVYSFDIPELKRTVRIFLNPEAHFQIVRWEVTYPTVFDGKLRTSVYSLKESKKLPYWKLNQKSNGNYRDSLKLN